MRRVAALVLLVAVACSGGSDEQAATTTTEQPTTTVELSPDEAYLEALRTRVDFDNPEWGEQALSAAKQVCDTLDASRDVFTDDAPNDTPQTDSSIAASFADMTLSVFYDSAGDDLQVTADVLTLGAAHFCPDWGPVVEADAMSRGLDP